MTTISFGLSATFSVYSPGESEDAYWTPLSTAIAWVNSTMPDGDEPTFYPTSSSGSVDVPIYNISSLDETTLLSPTFDGGYAAPSSVQVDSFILTDDTANTTFQNISLLTGWNSVKDIELSNLSAQCISVTGFVDTWINAPTDNTDHTITVNEAKRGAVSLGNGDDNVSVYVASNEYTWSNTLDITAGDGNDSVYVQPEYSAALSNMSAPQGYTFNTAPELTTANVTLGNGTDTVNLREVTGNIQVGNGNDTINITGGGTGDNTLGIPHGNATLWLGSGNDTVTISGPGPTDGQEWALDAEPSSLILHFGTGHDDVTVDDSNGPPVTTLRFMPSPAGSGANDPAAVVRVGHDDASGNFQANGDLENDFFIDTSEFPWQDAWVLNQGPNPGEQLLQVLDSSSGAVVDTFALYGANLPSVAWLRFIERS